jgi:hypothetical protein
MWKESRIAEIVSEKLCAHAQRTVQKVFNCEPYGSRKVGRPKLRWEDGVLQDIIRTGGIWL